MYIPNYKITTSILRFIAAIEASREVIENAPLVPAWEVKFKEDALVRAVHFGTHLEGNSLEFVEAQKVIVSRQPFSPDRNVQEVINYRRVLDYINSLAKPKKQHFRYTQKIIKDIHKLSIHRLVPEAEAGHYRQANVSLRDSRTGRLSYSPPPSPEVPYLIEDFLYWLNDSLSFVNHHPIIRAAIAHYVLVAVHPFTEANGRTARAFSTLVLFMEGYDTKRFFSIEEYFDKDSTNYFKSLMAVSSQPTALEKKDLTPWIEYFCLALSVELNKVKDKVRRLSLDLRLKKAKGIQIALSPRQIKLVEYLETTGQLTMSEAKKILPMISEDTILREIKDLICKNLVVKKGSTKGAHYQLNP